jgi:hypothetical protein
VHFLAKLSLAAVVALACQSEPALAQGIARYCELGPAGPQPEAPVYGQQYDDTCAIACLRMVIRQVTGSDVSEATLRQETQQTPCAYRPGRPAPLIYIAEPLLRLHGVQGYHQYYEPGTEGSLVAALERLTSPSCPAITGFCVPGRYSHAVVVRGVWTRPDGSKHVMIADPSPQGQGSRYSLPAAKFEELARAAPELVTVGTPPPAPTVGLGSASTRASSVPPAFGGVRGHHGSIAKRHRR